MSNCWPGQQAHVPVLWLYEVVAVLAVEHRLSGYDTSYLELAIRMGLPLATLVDDLRKAAQAAGVALIQASSR